MVLYMMLYDILYWGILKYNNFMTNLDSQPNCWPLTFLQGNHRHYLWNMIKIIINMKYGKSFYWQYKPYPMD